MTHFTWQDAREALRKVWPDYYKTAQQEEIKVMEDVKVVKLGLGEVTSNWGTYDGFPAVFIEPVSPSGPVGELARGEQKTSVVPGGLILQFQKPEGAGVLVEDINSALEKFYGEDPIK